MKKIIIGLDFDGVVAYNPIRLVRAPITIFKREVLGVTKTKFFIPKNNWQRWIFKMLHETSIFPARGVELLKQLGQRPDLEFHLVTGRVGYLRPGLEKLLLRFGLTKLFKSIHINEESLQPHLFKEQIIKAGKFDYYIEDNWDIVAYLSPRVSTKIFWVYNLLDRNKKYQYKFPYLEKALDEITF